MLLSTMTVKEAVALFEKAEAEALAVVEAKDDREVILVRSAQEQLLDGWPPR